uniref:Putative secreted peptide n=1 Tax=Anopheles braziliensis TaxID=58242 RepID=A0A2M3ZMA5_9DIPT
MAHVCVLCAVLMANGGTPTPRQSWRKGDLHRRWPFARSQSLSSSSSKVSGAVGCLSARPTPPCPKAKGESRSLRS